MFGASLAGLRQAFELGINHFDTAEAYDDGHLERILSEFLREAPRDQIIISSKVEWFRGTASNAIRADYVRH